jgi:hypothetical protein
MDIYMQLLVTGSIATDWEGATIAYPSVFQLAPNIVSRIFVFLSVGQSVGHSLF